jgi:hypothetical protein
MGTSITEARLKLLHESAGQADWEFIKTIDLFTDGNPAGTRVEIIIPIADNKKI